MGYTFLVEYSDVLLPEVDLLYQCPLVIGFEAFQSFGKSGFLLSRLFCLSPTAEFLRRGLLLLQEVPHSIDFAYFLSH